MKQVRHIAVSLLAGLALLPGLCAAQAKPVKIIVPAQPGGGLDLIGWGLVPPGATYENTVDNRAWQ